MISFAGVGILGGARVKLVIPLTEVQIGSISIDKNLDILGEILGMM